MKKTVNKKTLYQILIAAVIVVIVLLAAITGSSKTSAPSEGEKVPSLSVSDLEKPGTRIAVITASELYNAAEEKFPEAEILQFDNFADVFNAMFMGKADAALGYATQFPIVEEAYPSITNIKEPITTFSYGFGAQKNDQGKKLIEQMNVYFEEFVGGGKYDALVEKWSSTEEQPHMEKYSFSGKNGTLRVATPGTWSPMSFYYNGELTGVFIEMINGFCEAYGYTPQFESMPYPSEITALKTGQVDVIADTIVTLPDRMESINIMNPFISSDVYVFVPISAQESDVNVVPHSFFQDFKNGFITNFMKEARWKMLVSGLRTTLLLSVFSGIFGTLLGALICFLRMCKNNLAYAAASLYVRFFRGVPIVVLLLVLNYLIFGADFPSFWVCVVGFSLDFAAYASEMFRNGIEAVPAGQARAARALGFGSVHGFRKVVLPQALTHIIPVYSGQFISMVKLTSVAGYISVMDLTRASDIIRSRTFDAFFPLLFTTLIYLILCVILNALLHMIEIRIVPGKRNREAMKAMIRETCGNVLGEGTGSLSETAGTAPARQRKLPSETAGTVPARQEREVLFHVSHVHKSFGNVTPVKDISCEVCHGDVISIIGPSGTGKSSFINLLNRMETADGGEILFKGKNILAKDYDITGLRKQVGMVFQSFFLFSHLTIVENIMLAQMELLNRSKEEACRHSMEVLEKVGLSDKAANYPDELSGGQQQRVAVARAVAMDPDMILFDEPTSALDPTTIGEVLAVIRNLAANGMTMMIVTHEMNFARDVSNRVFYLDEGILYEEGTPKQIFYAPQKEKTRQFIYQLKVLPVHIKGMQFDYGSAITEIETFGYRHMINRTMVLHMITIMEELGLEIIRRHFGEKTDVDILFEYKEKTGDLDVKLTFAGDDFNPLEEGDPTSLALIHNAAKDLTCEIRDGKHIIEGSLRE